MTPALTLTPRAPSSVHSSSSHHHRRLTWPIAYARLIIGTPGLVGPTARPGVVTSSSSSSRTHPQGHHHHHRTRHHHRPPPPPPPSYQVVRGLGLGRRHQTSIHLGTILDPFPRSAFRIPPIHFGPTHRHLVAAKPYSWPRSDVRRPSAGSLSSSPITSQVQSNYIILDRGRPRLTLYSGSHHHHHLPEYHHHHRYHRPSMVLQYITVNDRNHPPGHLLGWVRRNHTTARHNARTPGTTAPWYRPDIMGTLSPARPPILKRAFSVQLPPTKKFSISQLPFHHSDLAIIIVIVSSSSSSDTPEASRHHHLSIGNLLASAVLFVDRLLPFSSRTHAAGAKIPTVVRRPAIVITGSGEGSIRTRQQGSP